MSKLFLALLLLFFPISVPFSAEQQAPFSSAQTFHSSPLMFIENVGQWEAGARFQVRGEHNTMWLAKDAIWITVIERPADASANSRVDTLYRVNSDVEDMRGKAANIKLSFLGSNPRPHLRPLNRVETHVSFLIGSDPTKWQTDVPVWGGVRYEDLYPGIDLELTGEQGELVPRLVIQPGANLSVMRLRVEGADEVAVEGDALRLSTPGGDVTWPLPRTERLVARAAVRSSDAQRFEVIAPFGSPEDIGRSPAVGHLPSPTGLLYSTFLGGSAWDEGYDIAVDDSGAAYVTGYTWSSDFPTVPGTFDQSYNEGGDVFVAKLNATGSAMDYATFLGGFAFDEGTAIAVDRHGAAYVTGRTQSPDFPTTPDAFNPNPNGDQEAFVAKLNPTGSALDYATYLGGGNTDYGYGIAVDGNGAAYVTGLTYSTYFPTTPGAFDTSFAGDNDGFVAKLNPAGSALDYATFLGGSNSDQGEDVAVDGSGAAYVTGGTNAPDFPITPGAFDPTLGDWDGFVVKLNPDGSALGYATFVGGTNGDGGYGIAVDRNGEAYVTGETRSSDFPTTPGAFDTSLNSDRDVFVIKLSAIGSALDYATYLGGVDWDVSYGITFDIAVDGSGAAYVTGRTESHDFPTSCGAMKFSGNKDAFVAKLNEVGSDLDYATFLGGSGLDGGYGIAADESGAAYVIGLTESSNFPSTPGAFDTSHDGNTDAFVAKLAMEPGVCFYLPLILRGY